MINININLIAERRARKIREITTLRWSTIAVLFIMLSMLVFNVIVLADTITERTELERVTAELHEKEAKRAELQQVLDQIEVKAPVVRLLEQVRMSEGAWITILSDLSRIMPHEVAISNFSVNSANEGVKIRLTGRARDERTVGSFLQLVPESTRWAETPTLGNISAESLRNSDSQSVRFDMIIPVKGLYGGDL